MRILGSRAIDAAGPEPCGEAIDQLRQIFFLPGRGEMIVLPGGQFLGPAYVQPDHVEAEAGIDRVGQGIDPLAQ